jgi:phosphomannomutase
MQNIKFGTDGWRAIIAQDFTCENVARVSYATAKWLLNRTPNPVVVIGHDCRFAGELFVETAIKVLTNMGVKVLTHKGFVSTPMVSLATVKLKANAGIVITASHNPPSYNGFKIKDSFGGPAAPAEITLVESHIPAATEIPATSLQSLVENGMLSYIDMETLYENHVRESFDLQAIDKAVKLGYDAMYGAGQRILPRLLPSAVMLHADYNPGFNGQAPEPLERNTKEFQQFIREKKSVSAGLITDGDADRIAMYDENGKFIDAHHILLLLIHYTVKYRQMNGKVVVAFSTSDKIKKICQHYNIPVEITKIGFKYIAEKMLVEDILVGGEESGGISVKGHIPERDGIWDGLLLLDLMRLTGKSMSQLIQEVYDIVGAFVFERLDLHLTEEKKQEIIARCEAGSFSEFGEYKVERIETIDGYKYHLGHERWIMIRPSGTEPLLRVYGEARSSEEVNHLLETVRSILLA